jgi:hypothetical protein
VIGTEVVIDTAMSGVGRSIAGSHLHSTHGIDCVADAPAKTVPILGEPPHGKGEEYEEEV